MYFCFLAGVYDTNDRTKETLIDSLRSPWERIIYENRCSQEQPNRHRGGQTKHGIISLCWGLQIFDDTVEELGDFTIVRVLKSIKKEGPNCLFVEKTWSHKLMTLSLFVKLFVTAERRNHVKFSPNCWEGDCFTHGFLLSLKLLVALFDDCHLPC